MTQERKQILDMVAQGKISVQDAERLLDRVSSAGAGLPGAETGSTEPSGAEPRGNGEAGGTD